MIFNYGNNTSRRLFGRKRIYHSLPDYPLTPEGLLSILEVCFKTHAQNCADINYLYNFYKGDQDILYRSNKEVRPEIDERIVENYAKYIAKFKNGFIWGEPIQLIKNSNGSAHLKEGEKLQREGDKDLQVIILNEYFQERNKHAKDKECALWSLICGVGYMSILPSKDEDTRVPFDLYVLDPRQTFIVYNNDFTKKPSMGVTYYTEVVGDNEFDYVMTIYTKEHNYTIRVDGDLKSFKEFNVIPNILKDIPIVEFNYDEVFQGCFEHVIPLLNAINMINSDRLNDVEQAVQWFMKFINVDIDEEQYNKFKAKGVIVVQQSEQGATPVVDSVVNTLDQAQIQVFKNDMVKSLFILCNIPERNADPGNNTGQALVVGQGWADAESNANDVEAQQYGSQKQLLRLAIKICRGIRGVPTIVKGAYAEEVDFKFTRNRSDNLLIKTQALQTMLKSGVHPLLAFKICGLFSDPQKAYELSKEYLEKFFSEEKPNKRQEGTIDATQNDHNIAQQQKKENEKGQE